MHYFPSLLAALLAPIAVSAMPVRRDLDPEDTLVLNYADTLEALETQFYTQMLSTFSSSDFTTAGFVNGDFIVGQLQTIQSQESTHVTTIQSLLGNTPPLGCTFDFSSALTTVQTALGTARVLENVGVGAYLGATVLIQSPEVLLDAGSIMTVEARHQTVLNLLNNGTAIPQAFDLPLAPQEVLSTVNSFGFVSGCDLSSDLGIQANVPLTLNNTGVITTGTPLVFESPALNSSSSGFFCQLMTNAEASVAVLPIESCVVPPGVNGPVAVFLTTSDQPLSGDLFVRSNQSVLAGPAITFVDVPVDSIGTPVVENASST